MNPPFQFIAPISPMAQAGGDYGQVTDANRIWSILENLRLHRHRRNALSSSELVNTHSALLRIG